RSAWRMVAADTNTCSHQSQLSISPSPVRPRDMLAQTSFPKAQVDHCRNAFDALIETYKAKPDEFEPRIACVMVLALDRCFVHRMRGQEGKGDSALKRTRDLSDAIAQGRSGPPTIDEFAQLADAFFTEIEVKFPPA